MATTEPAYAGYTRFEIELEFVQTLANPWYLNYLAAQKMFEKPAFVEYLKYLQYFREPEYAKFLSYPGPTLRALELLQQESFRRDILIPEVMMRLFDEGVKAATTER
ncbi:SOH1-domain-containing protein [Trichodelitschia bisporula]|uniref:Mediator of RNA polymerase II transcription subunit 31 n=1 Tax=Trichodelitschia bisporula TaxID=703511 RepID=A0A6G1I667_9PEZI|nr:SOH1-domain-containing protein [Trichodelitschia bisporula]